MAMACDDHYEEVIGLVAKNIMSYLAMTDMK